ncbi:MAG: sugar transferase [Myxococcaceae bacterium]
MTALIRRDGCNLERVQGLPWDKRAMDLALLLPVLPFASAVVGVLAALVRLLDGAPVFFVQERVGLGGRRFKVYKLRTMSCEPEVAARKPTRLGQWLRLRGLDELPQLFNVLKGEMSLVGPRPLEPAHFERLCAQRPEFRERLEVAPGITGLAQVTQAIGLDNSCAMDREYAATRTLPFDLYLIARTAWMNLVGKKRGAWQR